jgi:hypothetical protein
VITLVLPTPPFPPIERITRFPAAGILAAGELEIVFVPFILPSTLKEDLRRANLTAFVVLFLGEIGRPSRLHIFRGYWLC